MTPERYNDIVELRHIIEELQQLGAVKILLDDFTDLEDAINDTVIKLCQ